MYEPNKPTDIVSLSLVELKALIYDMIALQGSIQRDMQVVELEIEKRKATENKPLPPTPPQHPLVPNPPKKEVKEGEKK